MDRQIFLTDLTHDGEKLDKALEAIARLQYFFADLEERLMTVYETNDQGESISLAYLDSIDRAYSVFASVFNSLI